jgi:cellulose synthase/poly-beta-1,6-N-acetylglucosamine synthase-like glycosyltransferase
MNETQKKTTVLVDQAIKPLMKNQIMGLLLMVLILIASLVIAWRITLIIVVSLTTAVYFSDLCLNLYLIYRSLRTPAEVQVIEFLAEAIASNRDWPNYTIFCPLYKEWEVLPQFIHAMNQIDYPVSRLQILLLLEEDDTETLRHIRAMDLPATFQVVIVADSQPKTKPKACNVGLELATGEYSVIYDAEDIPARDQLKQAVLAFEQSSDKVVCIQAKLNFYNPNQNILTRLFTAEYSLWFDLMLTGLMSINGPIPLGGTSNHFRTPALQQLGGWDPYNVTEDCDLGIRLAKQGYRTAIIDSVTLEEANSKAMNWYHQRTRWIKGYIQTYWFHMRNLSTRYHTWGVRDVLLFQSIVGGKILAMFINPFMWVLTLSYFIFRAKFGSVVESIYPLPVLYLAVTSLIFGNFLFLYYYMMGCARRGHWNLIKYALLVPIYWLAMSVAAWKALYEFFVKPHHWAKTQHGLHLGDQTTSSNIDSLFDQPAHTLSTAEKLK